MDTNKAEFYLDTIEYEEDAYDFAFDACEAVYLLACEWGEYAALAYLTDANFRPSPLLSYDNLSENGKAIYDMLDADLTARYYV